MSEHPEQLVPPPEESYLWDGSAPVDASVERIEREVAPLRLGGEGMREPVRARAMPRVLAAAAVLLLVGAAVWWAARPVPILPKEVVGATWRVAVATGVTIGDEQVNKSRGAVRRVEVGAGARGEVRTGAGSEFHLGAGSVVELVEGQLPPTLRLLSGDVSGRVVAADQPIRVMIADRGVRVHRGEASFSTGLKGESRVTVGEGWAEVDGAGGKLVRPPVRLAAEDRLDVGATDDAIPLTRDVTPMLAKVYSEYVSTLTEKMDPKLKWERLEDVLQEADFSAAPLLWNLCWRVSRDERARIIVRLDELVPAKLGSSRESRADLDPAAMDELWDAIAARADDARRKGK